jgi:hypothetical protein
MLALSYAQLIAGVVAGLIIWMLVLWTPMLRDLLAAVAAAGIIDLLVGNHTPPGTVSLVDRLAAEISGHPHFSLGLILSATLAATLFRVLRSQ